MPKEEEEEESVQTYYTLEDLKWDAFQASHLIFKGNVADK
jgi:hypothetical protein